MKISKCELFNCFKDPKLGDWLWELRERRRQQRRSTNYRQLARLTWTQRNASSAASDETGPFNSSVLVMNASESVVILERFLNEGKWLVTDREITENRMSENRKERLVSCFIFNSIFINLIAKSLS